MLFTYEALIEVLSGDHSNETSFTWHYLVFSISREKMWIFFGYLRDNLEVKRLSHCFSSFLTKKRPGFPIPNLTESLPLKIANGLKQEQQGTSSTNCVPKLNPV